MTIDSLEVSERLDFSVRLARETGAITQRSSKRTLLQEVMETIRKAESG